jgi:DNA polymerase elongation subunit (family B)
MEYLVFDIETAPIDFESFSHSQQEYLLRGTNTEEEAEKQKNLMGLSPLTAKVVCIGLKRVSKHVSINSETKKEEVHYDESKHGVSLSLAPEMDFEGDILKSTLPSGNTIIYYKSELDLIKDFWKGVELRVNSQRSTLVSFNGRNFDAPFLMLRSAVLGFRPSQNLMEGTKFNYRNHIDLMDELTFFMPSNSGATKRYNFDFYTQAFGLVSPKAAGVDGTMVGQLFDQKDYDTIAEYCLRDVSSTFDLFKIWDKLLNFKN